MEDPEMKPQLLALVEQQAECAKKVYALTAALEANLFDVAEEMLDEILAEGPIATKRVMYALVGSFAGMLEMVCSLSDMRPEEMLSALAVGNSMMPTIAEEMMASGDF